MEYKGKYFLGREKKNRIVSKTKIASFPDNALIELSNACNHLCVFCNNPRMKRKVNTLDKNIYTRFLVEAYQSGLREIGLYATGEPFLTKDISWYIKEAKKKGIERIYLTTNGSLASLEKVINAFNNGLNSIKYSVNAGTKENYKIIHGKDDFLKVCKNIKDVFDWKTKNNIDLHMLGSFIYTKKTVNEIPVYKETLGKYFDDVKFFPAGSQGGRINNIIETISTDFKEKELKNVEPCEMLWNRLHLTCEGFLTACCIDYELDLVYANFKDSKINVKELWNNSIMQKLRLKHLEKKLDNTVCKNCLLGTKDKYKKLTDVPIGENKKLKTSDVENRTMLASKQN